MRASLLFILNVAISVALSQRAQAFEWQPTHWRQGDWALTTDGHYKTSDQNFTPGGGEFEPVPNNGEFSAAQIELEGLYALTGNISTRFGLIGSYSSVSSEAGSDSSVKPVGVSGEFEYAFSRKWVVTILQLRGYFTLDPLDPATSKVLTSEGVHLFEPSLLVTKTFGAFKPAIEVGGRIPTEGLAKLVTYRVATELHFQKFFMGAGAHGFFPFAKDELTDEPTNRTSVTSRVNSGSLHYYSLNPSLLEAGGWLGFKLTPDMILRGGLSHSLNGRNYSSGTSFLFGLTMRFGYDETARGRKRRASYGATEDGFQVETRNETDLFNSKENGAPKEQIEYGADGEPIKKKRRVKRTKKLRKPVEN